MDTVETKGTVLQHNCINCDVSFETTNDLENHNCDVTPISSIGDGKEVINGNKKKKDSLCKKSVSKDKRNTKNATKTKKKNCSLNIMKDKDEVVVGRSSGNKKKVKKKKLYECELCEKSYSFAHGLRAHQLTHSGEKPHECDTCGKAFSQRSFLIVHIRTHTDERPFPCEKCGKAFHQPSHLRYHLLTHSRKRSYRCRVCGKRLRYKQSLQLHLRVHNREKPFSCESCGKSFYEKPKLKIHMRVHTGEKPYACDICGRTFAQKGNCDKHKERYHARDADRKFPCKLCPKAFIWKKCLEMHLQWHKLTEKRKLGSAEPPSLRRSSRNEKKKEIEADECPSLEQSMCRLLPHLLDEEVLTEIGWPSAKVDKMVIQVLRWCDLKPKDNKEEFECNVQMLLNIVLQEKFNEVDGLQGKSPNAIIQELLKLTIKTH